VSPAKANIWRVAEEEETITEREPAGATLKAGMAVGNGQTGVKEGVNAPINSIRNGDGRFAKGHSGGPGRPSKAKEIAMLEAIRSTFTPERVAQHLNDAMDIAVRTNSARGIVAVLEFAANYTMGKPVQRTQEVRQSIADILNDDGESE
jgi:hypothetical protein